MRINYLFLIVFFIGCDQIAKDKQKEKEYSDKSASSGPAMVDTATSIIDEASIHDQKIIATTQLPDTALLRNAPVKVISAVPVKREYSNYKDIRLVYKNVSGKTISAIRFRWYGINAFNEAAEMGGRYAGVGSGFTDDQLKNNRTADGQWEILSVDLKKVLKAWPYEVVFQDGTKWELDTK